MKRFTDSHEWVILEAEGIVRIGVTADAQKELGDIVYVELPIVGKYVRLGQEIAVLESVKAAVDLYSPVSGEILAVNARLQTLPELINRSPEEEGWIYQIRLSNPEEFDLLRQNE